MEHYKFNYINYRVHFFQAFFTLRESQEGDYQETSFKQMGYRAVIDMQKKYGFTDGEEKITKEFKEYRYTMNHAISGYILNWIDKTWWDYGYDKGRIFKITFTFLIVFFVINMGVFKKLVHEVYPIDEFVVNDASSISKSFKDIVRYMIYCMYYTGYVFLGFKLDFKVLKLKRLGYASYIIFQSVLGLVCLAYLASYIISR